ncbi:MAG: histidine kinase [Bacteroidota bacterium]
MESSFFENELLSVIFIGILIMLSFAFAFFLFFFFSQKKFQTEQLKAQARELEHQEQLLYSSIQTQEQERERIARELHDDIGSKLSVINMGLHRIRRSKDLTTLPDVLDILAQTTNSARQISHQLLPPILKNFGLAAAMHELCDNYDNASEGMEVSFESSDENLSANTSEIALAFFRIIQELLSNSFKYSEASEIKVKLSLEQEQLKLTYVDNGKGFDQHSTTHQTGLGMQNIESRVRMIDAQQQLRTAPGEGLFFELIKTQA